MRKSDRLKSEGDFEGERQIEEWSPADRFSDSHLIRAKLPHLKTTARIHFASSVEKHIQLIFIYSIVVQEEWEH